MASTRRLAAILAADVAGHARLMELDESGTLRGLRTIRTEPIDPTIAAHNKRRRRSGSVIWVGWRISYLLSDISAKQIMNADRGDGGCDLEASG
jgi:hypothetical protein